MKKIGITTTVPIEILHAAGYQAYDLNNLLATDDHPERFLECAEKEGFPKNLCAFIKGIYGVSRLHDVERIVGVVEGDCSNTKAMLEVMMDKGIESIPFGYPHTRTYEAIKREMDALMTRLNVSYEAVEETRKQLFKARRLAKEIDRLTYETHQATGFENHLYQVCMSDFFGDVSACASILEQKIQEIQKRPMNPPQIRLAFIGVPPMASDIYPFLESIGARVIYNEVQHEFVFPRAEEAKDIYEQYLDFTYPYDLNGRLKVIRHELEKRQVDGVIHYTQAFCYRAIEDIKIKTDLPYETLHLEGDKDTQLDARSKLRLEAFVDLLKDKKWEALHG